MFAKASYNHIRWITPQPNLDESMLGAEKREYRSVVRSGIVKKVMHHHGAVCYNPIKSWIFWENTDRIVDVFPQGLWRITEYIAPAIGPAISQCFSTASIITWANNFFRRVSAPPYPVVLAVFR